MYSPSVHINLHVYTGLVNDLAHWVKGNFIEPNVMMLNLVIMIYIKTWPLFTTIYCQNIVRNNEKCDNRNEIRIGISLILYFTIIIIMSSEQQDDQK